jgi:hypothetical protein
VVAGWNDYCLTDLGTGWQGFAYSTDSGETWTDSLVPGYPQDTSGEGQASPLFGDHTDAGDPIAAFDNDGNLFVGGISFNREGPVNGDVWVATYGTQEGPNGYPVDYLRTRIVGEGTPTRGLGGGIFQDKPLLEVDRTAGQYDGNVYVCWSVSRAAVRTASCSAARRIRANLSPARSPSPPQDRSGRCRAATSRSRPTATFTSPTARS